MTDKQLQKQRCRKKTREFHFVDMNDPDRYKKIKVTRACDFCRKRKSKCDIGIPNSGTCSNCKKAKQLCVFSNVPSNVDKDPPVDVLGSRRATVSVTTVTSSPPATMSGTVSSPNKTLESSFSNIYQDQHPYLSLDQRGVLGYEKYKSTNAHLDSQQQYQQEQEAKVGIAIDNIDLDASDVPTVPLPHDEISLLGQYLEHIHPLFPILHASVCRQIRQYRRLALPAALRLAILSISLFFNKQLDKAASYQQQASLQVDRTTPSMETIQTLFLLYKFQELITPVGAPLSSETVLLLKEIQTLIFLLSNRSDGSASPLDNEYLCRANWMLYVIITMSSTADDRWRQMLETCIVPNRLPVLKSEQVPLLTDGSEWSTTCNLIHLININRIFSRVLCLISDKSTLFVNADKVGRSGDASSNSDDNLLYAEFDKIKSSLVLWRTHLPMDLYFTTTTATATTTTTTTALSPASSTVISYLYLIHDIIDLIISIQLQSSALHYHLTSIDDLFEKASNVCYRAYHLSILRGNDDAKLYPPKLTCIQGSRIISFGLTLALQTHCYYFHEQKKEKKEPSQNIKRFHYSCSLAFQIFDSMSLSPHLYMAIATLRAQLSTQEQLLIDMNQAVPKLTGADSFTSGSSSGSSALQTPMAPLDSPTAPQPQQPQSYLSNLSTNTYGSSMYENSRLLQQLSDYNSSHSSIGEVQNNTGKDFMCNHPGLLLSAFACHYSSFLTVR